MKAGRFPVVIYAPSLNAPATENIELYEFLASKGFVVIAGPSMGATSRSMTVDISGANAETQDISFLINFAITLPDTDASEVAVAGYSWGGMAALFAAARDKRVDALISLDGSFRYSPENVQEAGDIHPDRMTNPLLVFSRAEETLETWDAMRKDKTQCDCAPNVLNEWTRGDLLHVRLLAISHIQFSSLYQRSERFRKEGMRFAPADYSLEEGAVMDTTFPGNHGIWRALISSAAGHSFYVAIIVWEIVTTILLWWGRMALSRAIRRSAFGHEF
jgi:pimeloyl-ACP methyl ester carboxylesterase